MGGVKHREAIGLLALVAIAFLLSGIQPHDRTTWVLEALPVMIGAPVLLMTANRFALTPLSYRLLFVHALILLLGAHYTYSEVPPGEWAERAFGFSRNHYDRFGHLMQGVTPAIVGRELLLRTSRIERGRWLFVIVTSICLAFSAFYEMTEWWAALIGGEAANAFLGTQGDVWDTQWDMFLALIGSILAQLTLSRSHDAELRRLPAEHGTGLATTGTAA